jgi:Xaa-Pro aminopeptidase
MDRRDAIKAMGLATAGVASFGMAAGSAKGADAKTRAVTISDTYQYPGVTGKLLVNKPRAYEVMEALGIDGIVAADPINVHYLANSVTTLTKMHADDPAFATFPRDPSQTSFFITSTGSAMETANGDREVPEIIPFSYPATWATSFVKDAMERPTFEPPALSGKFGVKENADFTPRERAWLEAQDKYNAEVAPTSMWALVRALKASGLTRGVVAVDDMRIVPQLQHMGLTDVKFVPGNNVFRRIRVVKSETELAMMRVAQANNAAAAMAAARSLEEGMTYAQFQRRFEDECAARGSVAGFVLLGFTQALLPDHEIKRGRSYMLDAFSQAQGYYGDFARTVVIGDPTADMMARFKAQRVGRAEGFAMVKPGVPFHVVEETAKNAMIKAGMPAHSCSVSLHSVGLQHVDHPNPLEAPFDYDSDYVLRENMTITLDLPYLELGWGAGHNEDMLRVTKTGYEVLNDESDPMVIV